MVDENNGIDHGNDEDEEDDENKENQDVEEDGKEKSINDSLKWNELGDLGPQVKDVMVQAYTRSGKETPAKKKKRSQFKTPIDRSPDHQVAADLEIQQKRAYIRNFRELIGLTKKDDKKNEE